MLIRFSPRSFFFLFQTQNEKKKSLKLRNRIKNKSLGEKTDECVVLVAAKGERQGRKHATDFVATRRRLAGRCLLAVARFVGLRFLRRRQIVIETRR